MDFTMVIPVLIAFVLSVAAGPVVIPVLRRLKMDQTEREDGVKSHLKKAGTPTMGGVMILFAIAVTSLIYVREYPKVIFMFRCIRPWKMLEYQYHTLEIRAWAWR